MQDSGAQTIESLWLGYKARENKNLSEFFKDHQIHKVALTGSDFLCDLLHRELSQGDINISERISIDASSDVVLSNVRNVDFDDVSGDADIAAEMIVICTDDAHAIDIYKTLRQKYRTTLIVYLSEVIECLKYKNIFIPYIQKNVRHPIVIYSLPQLRILQNLSDTEKFLIDITMETCHLDFFANNPRYFELIYADVTEYDTQYIKEVFYQPPLIRRNRRLVHSDFRSRYVNIINGYRLTSDTPEDCEAGIVLIGDCRILGIGLDDGRTVASCLQRKLNAATSTEYNVINSGVWGTGIALSDVDQVIAYISDNIPAGNGAVCVQAGIARTQRAFVHQYLNRLTKQYSSTIHYYEFFNEFNSRHSQEILYFDAYHLSPAGANFLADLLSDIILSIQEDIRHSAPRGNDGKRNDAPAIGNMPPPAPSKAYDGLDRYIASLKNEYRHHVPGTTGAIVVNCNPFTNGHRYVIETASRACDFLYVFVVEENRSFFDFEDRLMLVREGTKDLQNVRVVPSGKFIISTITFPEYFVKDAAKEVTINAADDVEIFAKYIAPALNISVRFVGSEPFCDVTRQYNATMKEIFPRYRLKLAVIERICAGERAISASEIRALMKQGDLDKIKQLVPECTYKYIAANAEKLLQNMI